MVPFPHRPHFRSSIFLLASILLVFLGFAASQPEGDSPADASAAKHVPGRLVCKPCKMDFGKVQIGQSRALPIVLSNQGHSPVTISSKDKQAPWVSPLGLVLPYTLQPGKEIKFHLVFSPRDGRRVNGHIAYRSNAQNALLPISVIAETASGGALGANPARLDFGNVAVGSSATQSETITNVGNASVTIQQVTESGSGLSVGSVTTPQTLAPGHSVTFQVQFTPQKTGADMASLIVLSNATNYRLSVVETGTGTAAGSVSISPSTLDFGDVPVGSSKSKTLTLTANGASMTIKSDALSSSEYSISGLTLPLKLAAGKSVSFQTKFTPQAPGAASANASFTVASPTSSINAALTGTGTSAAQHSVSLSWNADSSPVAGYNVYRSAKSKGPYAQLTSPLDSSNDYVDTTVTTGNTYYYEVTAVNSQGQESAPSKPVAVTVP